MVLLRSSGGLRAFADRCPHQGGLLSGGDLRAGLLVCPNHGWAFDVETGACTTERACLSAFAVREHEGSVWVRLEAPPAAPRPAAGEGARRLREITDLSGPPGAPLLGVARQIEIDRLPSIFEEWASRYGSVFRYDIGRRPSLCVAEPQLIEQILRNRPDGFRRAKRLQTALASLEAAGVFSAEGDDWRGQRRLVMDALSPRNLRLFYPHLRTIGERLHRRFARAAEQGEELDLQREMMRFTVDVTTWLSLGRDVNTLESSGGDLQGHLEVFFPEVARRVYGFVPWWRLLPTPGRRRAARALAGLHAWVDPMIDEIRDRQARDASLTDRPETLLEAMVAARDDRGEPYPREAIFANALVMLLGGEDTTANTMAWAVHELCEGDEARQELEREASELLGEARVPRDIEQIEAARFALCVAHETTRRHPVAPLLLVEARTDQVVGDLRVPAGTRISLLLRSGAHSAEAFREPMSFLPWRWQEPGVAARLQKGATHVPFGLGPRMCPARSLALLELRMLLLVLYRSFRFHRVIPASRVSAHYQFTLEPRGVRALVERID